MLARPLTPIAKSWLRSLLPAGLRWFICALAIVLAPAVAQVPSKKPQQVPPVSHPSGPAITAADRGERPLSGWRQALNSLWQAPSAGVSHYRAGRFHQAFASLQQDYFRSFGSSLKSGVKQEAEALFNLAAAAFRLGDYAKAEGLLLKLLRTHYRASREEAPQGLAALSHYNLGNTLVALGKLDGAIAAYQQAMTLKEGFAKAAANLHYTQKLKEYLDRNKPPQQQDQSKDKQADEKNSSKDQQSKEGQSKQDQSKDQSKQDQSKDQSKQGPSKDQSKEDQAKQGQDSKEQQKKERADAESKTKDESSKDVKKQQGTSTWQSQKSLKQRNAERLLESIQEDRKNYLRRRLPKDSANGVGGKRW